MIKIVGSNTSNFLMYYERPKKTFFQGNSIDKNSTETVNKNDSPSLIKKPNFDLFDNKELQNKEIDDFQHAINYLQPSYENNEPKLNKETCFLFEPLVVDNIRKLKPNHESFNLSLSDDDTSDDSDNSITLHSLTKISRFTKYTENQTFIGLFNLGTVFLNYFRLVL